MSCIFLQALNLSKITKIFLWKISFWKNLRPTFPNKLFIHIKMFKYLILRTLKISFGKDLNFLFKYCKNKRNSNLTTKNRFFSKRDPLLLNFFYLSHSVLNNCILNQIKKYHWKIVITIFWDFWTCRFLESCQKCAYQKYIFELRIP